MITPIWISWTALLYSLSMDVIFSENTILCMCTDTAMMYFTYSFKFHVAET